MHGFVGIILRHRGSEHHLEGGGKTLRQRHGGVGYFPDNIWHNPSKLGRTEFGQCTTPQDSITDGIIGVKFSAIPRPVIGAPSIAPQRIKSCNPRASGGIEKAG